MESEPIKYSDLIFDDGAIQKAIDELELLKETYQDLNKTVKEYAATTKATMATASGATEEGRATTKKATEDTEKLAKAQRDLAFAMSEVGAQVAELKAKTADKNRETRLEAAYVQANAQSYNEFKAELTLLVNQYKNLTKEQALNSAEGQYLISRIISLKNAVKTLDEALKVQKNTQDQANATAKQATVTLTEQEKAERKLAQARSADNITLLNLMAQTKEANQVAKLNAIIANEQAGSYNALSAQYALNKIELNKMTVAQREQTEAGVLLVNQTHDMYMEMIRLQEVTGKHSLSVGNYRKVWDGLGHSVGQVVREMPAMAINANTLFLALSNNIPILVDEINNLKAANEAAAASGGPTVSVWKKISSALFSWNTVIVVGLTLLSMYGNQIIKFVKDLFTAEVAIMRLSKVAISLQEALKKGREDAQKELVHLRLLYNATQDVTKSMDYRLAAVHEMRKIYPGYLKDLTDEQILAGEAANAYTVLAASILKAAKARAAEETIVANEKKILELKDLLIGYQALALLEEKRRGKAASNVPVGPFGGIGGTYAADAASAKYAAEAVKDYGKQATETAMDISLLQSANKRLAEGIDVRDIFTAPDKEPKGRAKKEKAIVEDINRDNLLIQKMYAEAVTALNEDELVKRTEATRDAYEVDRRMLEYMYENSKTLTQDSYDKIFAIIEMHKKKMAKIDAEAQDAISLRGLKLQEETLNLMLEATEEGSMDEAVVRLQILENSRQQELITNRQLIESQRQDEAKINAKWDNIIMTERMKSNYDIGMKIFDQYQDFYASEFDLLRTSEEEKTKFKLEQEKLRWMKTLEMARIGSLKLTDIEIKTIENLIKKLQYDIEQADKKKVDIYSIFGLKLEEDEKQAIADAISETMKNLHDMLGSEIELAEIAIEKSQERVDAKKTAYEAEVEARNNGYAFNVSAAQRELEAEKVLLAKSMKQKEQAVLAQQQLDTVAQSSNLITASTGIWSSLSGIPVVGYLLATAAIAAMWGSFAASKAKAKEVTKAEAQLYGEGGFEVLGGGSHASGHDTNIGMMSDGRERRAEGGEGLAIFSKSKMRKYGALVPSIVNAINKGIFEDKYASSFDTGTINVMSNASSLRDLESDVRAIREQGESQRFVDSKGRIVVHYKNLKTTYLS